MGPRVFVPATFGAKIEKYAVVKYSPAVVVPRATCTFLPVELVALPPARLPVSKVATSGAVVISPSR